MDKVVVAGELLLEGSEGDGDVSIAAMIGSLALHYVATIDETESQSEERPRQRSSVCSVQTRWKWAWNLGSVIRVGPEKEKAQPKLIAQRLSRLDSNWTFDQSYCPLHTTGSLVG
ncbi:hypothetical protein CRG98_041389 [Punica granatum]|uniref:Uncharacterized protein n=1 Tax=Punica granatum TaxID=22663 RepID=A0A2I0I2K9_PUNGR|nr:hypothetical protein CRG98_041389 [Punica granatum]